MIASLAIALLALAVGATDVVAAGTAETGGVLHAKDSHSPEFYAYYGHMIRTIKERWVWSGEVGSLAASIRFRILPDGSIADARVTKPSRDLRFEEAALKAVRGAKLEPAPESVRADFADVELDFDAPLLQ